MTMTTQFFVTLVLGLTVISASLGPTTGQEECASNVSQCVTVAFNVFTNHPNDIPLVCRATDDFLMCIVKETRTCDPLVAASIKDSMSPMIDVYSAEPYNCNLESATNDALKPDLCAEQMSYCSIFYYQASSEAQFDYIGACSLFEVYLDCMNTNTSACGPDMQGFIEGHSTNATNEFDQSPLFCEERLQYPIDEVDSNMSRCYETLETMDMKYAKQDLVCGNYKEFFDCAIETLVVASPRQFEQYAKGVNDVGQSFRVRPYFCESEKPCLELFNACNESAYSPLLVPCQFMDVYASCLSNALGFCAESDYIEVAATTQELIGEIHNKYNCIEENKNKGFDKTTPIPEITTMENYIHTDSNENIDDSSTSNNNNKKSEKDKQEDPLPTSKPRDNNMAVSDVTSGTKYDKTQSTGMEVVNVNGDHSETNDNAEQSTNTVTSAPDEREKTKIHGDAEDGPSQFEENNCAGLNISTWMLLLAFGSALLLSKL